MALPRNGARGVEKIADTTAWTNSMAESGGALVKDNSKNMLCCDETELDYPTKGF